MMIGDSYSLVFLRGGVSELVKPSGNLTVVCCDGSVSVGGDDKGDEPLLLLCDGIVAAGVM